MRSVNRTRPQVDRQPTDGRASLMVLAAGCLFGLLPILGKEAYSDGLSTGQLLTFRFALATVVIFLIARVRGERWPDVSGATVIKLVALGAFGYFGASVMFFAALQSLPASFCELLQFVYPALVALEVWIFLGRPIAYRHFVALAASIVGAGLLVGAVTIKFDWALTLAICSPVVYSLYLVLAERLMTGLPPLLGSGLVMSGTAAGSLTFGLAERQMRVPISGGQWEIIVLAAVLTGVLGMPLILTGLPRTGAGRASVLSTAEPVVTVILAALVLQERLLPLQVVGGVLVIGAIVLLQARTKQTEPRSGPAARSPPGPAALRRWTPAAWRSGRSR